MIPSHILAKPVVLTVEQWNTILSALRYLPGVLADPIVEALQVQQQPDDTSSPEAG